MLYRVRDLCKNDRLFRGVECAVAEDIQIRASHDVQRCSLVSAILQAKKGEAEEGPVQEVSEYEAQHN